MKISIFENENQFESFIKSVQYIMRLTLQQDVYDNIAQVIANYFKASWVTFVRFSKQDQKYVYYGTTPANAFQDNLNMDTIEKTVFNVLDNGFLALESVLIPEPAQLVFLPLREHESNTMVMVIAHKQTEKLPKNLINTYLALSELSSTAIELRKHRNSLEEIIFERTKELESVNKLLKQINETNNKELIFANAFQASLMPRLKKFEQADMYGKYIPCSMVGGDLYDCVASGDSLWFIIADVAGHGLVAAMISTMVKGMFNECVANSVYPNEILENINNILCKMQYYMDSHLVSAFIGVIRDNTLLYSNAGHPYPVIINSADKSFRVIRQNGYLLGIECDTKYVNQEDALNQDEIILLYTDGFINPKRSEDADFEIRIGDYSLLELKLLKNNPQAFIGHVVDSLRKDYGKDFEDDASIMAIIKR